MAAGFAEQLRELKERSGLSYGVLAKRLHMSTSTLHRYCNGDAVPTDYAPVERLARLCRATPGELVELHRKWVLADATRGRKGGDLRAAGGDSAAASDGGVVAHEPPAPVADAAPGEIAGAGGAAGAREASGSAEGVPAGAAATAGAAVPEGVVVEGGPGARSFRTAPRPRRRTRVALVAGVAVAALVGAVTLAVSLPSDESGVDGGRRSLDDVPAGDAAGLEEGSLPSSDTSPSPSGSEADGKDAKDGKGAKGDGKGAPASAGAATPTGSGAGGGDSASLDPPLSVKVEPYLWESPCDQRYLVNRPPTDIPEPPPEQDAASWVARTGAVSSGGQYLRLTVQGTGKETVVVNSVTVRTVAKRQPLPWNDYVMGYPGVGCGAGVPTRSFTVALDAARPVVKPQAGSKDFPYSVSESDPEVYYITADASVYDVSWYLEVKWTSGSRSDTLTVNDEGRPFRTSGNNGRPAYEFPLNGKQWVKEGTTLGEDG
ncbi:helix-turn-helix domain-containing protein [Streptomyces torulosus]|uniref:helix-turn-helix domain-containing protein n=1 Tax=Streptomyces torulosus TaxID=68276 RepID=UPI0006EB9AB7|nr:helix-turn-helix transcriptional regulator [Streptomyces torulosus]